MEDNIKKTANQWLDEKNYIDLIDPCAWCNNIELYDTELLTEKEFNDKLEKCVYIFHENDNIQYLHNKSYFTGRYYDLMNFQSNLLNLSNDINNYLRTINNKDLIYLKQKIDKGLQKLNDESESIRRIVNIINPPTESNPSEENQNK